MYDDQKLRHAGFERDFTGLWSHPKSKGLYTTEEALELLQDKAWIGKVLKTVYPDRTPTPTHPLKGVSDAQVLKDKGFTLEDHGEHAGFWTHPLYPGGVFTTQEALKVKTAQNVSFLLRRIARRIL